MGTIKYSTALCSFSKGERPCYVAHVKHNGTIDQEAFLTAIAELSGETKERVRFAWDLALAEIRRQLKSGNRIELEQLAVGIAVQGTFSAANAAWDASKNRLVPYVNAKGELKGALEGVTTENITEGAIVAIRSVLDTVRSEDSIVSAPTVFVSGTNMTITPANPDEGVWLADADGRIVATATVTRSDATTIDAVFDTLPPSGNYKLVVAGRNGASTDYGVSMSKKNVEVING